MCCEELWNQREEEVKSLQVLCYEIRKEALRLHRMLKAREETYHSCPFNTMLKCSMLIACSKCTIKGEV